jgi:hypothetical protein
MELSELTPSAIDFIFDNVLVENLSDWEREFVESVSEQWTRRRSLSDKQKEVLGRIWDKQT